MMRGLLATLVLSLGLPMAQAACQFDTFGTISNPTDPSCRDAQFRYTRSEPPATMWHWATTCRCRWTH